MKKIGIIILAAGASRRMGQPKQLLKMTQQHTFVEHAIIAAKGTTCEQIVVVLGANAAAIQKIVASHQTSTIVNENWQAGMGTSLQKGLTFLLEQTPDLAAVIISVCDQPYLSATIFNQLIEQYRSSDAPIVSANYGQKMGVPALLDQQFFPELLALQADEGARRIIQNNLSLVATVEFAAGGIDLDTKEAYNEFWTLVTAKNKKA